VPPLHLFTMFKDTKFEFIFTPNNRAQSHMLLQTVDLLIKAFNASSRSREVRMRGVRYHIAFRIGSSTHWLPPIISLYEQLHC
jgi:hypothetical protein